MCRALEVSRSGYYAFKKRPESRRRIENEKLLIEIRRVFLNNDRNYGSPRIWNQLNNVECIRCSLNRVAKLMRGAGIVAVQKRKFRLTTNSRHDYPVWPNILCRNFTIERPNAVWVSDITYVWTFEGWLYLAAVLDLFSRGVVGLAMDKTIADTLVIQAMRQAILRRNPAIMLSTPLCEVNSLSFVSVLVCPIDGKLPLCFNIVGSHEPKKGKKFTFLISIHVYSPHKLELKEDHNEANSYAYFVCVACRIRCVI